MLRSACLILVVSTLQALVLLGCSSSQRQWEITVENKSDVPCSFFVTLGADGGSKSKVEDVSKGEAISLIVGDSNTVVQSVIVVRDKDDKTQIPKAELPVGKRYAIVVNADGKVETSVSDR